MKGFIELTGGRDENRRLSIAVKSIISFKESGREGRTILTLTSIDKDGLSEAITAHISYDEVIKLINEAQQ